MKKLFYLFVFIMTGILNVNLYSQTGELILSQVNDGFFADVSIHIKRTSAEPWNLGYASLVFNYNSSAMINPTEHLEGICDNETSPDYDDQIIVRYPGVNVLSIELGLNNATVTGTEIPLEPVLLGTIRFEITSPIGLHNISWNSIYTALAVENGTNVTQNITLINPTEGLLPVELTGFTGDYNSGEILLKWATANETNNYGFEIQRVFINNSNEKETEWVKAGFVEGRGNANTQTSYSFKDRNLRSGEYKYRLKQIDYNGNFEYFNLQNRIEVGLPAKYILHQNYPNPFNPITVIKFEIPEEAKVNISVYDMTGKEILVLADELYQPGIYEIKLDASSFAGGVYFYRISSNGFKQTKKFVYLK